MAVEIYMPKNGMDMTEGTIIRWLKEVGDHVDQDEAIMEIETDKITMESESPAEGYLLAKFYEDGAVVPVLTTLGYIGAKGEKVPDAPQTGTKEEKSATAPEKAPAKEAPAKEADNKVSYDYDVAIIGGGPAGYIAAIEAAMHGGKVIVFEKSVLGGTCLNRGCIPAKTYLNGAKYIRHIKDADTYGIKVDQTVSVDMKKAVANKKKVVKTLTDGVGALLRSHRIEVVYGEASLASKNEVVCDNKTYSANSILLCGGSKAGSIPIPGIDCKYVLKSDDILDLAEVPKRLAVIGGGVIGCEMATVFANYGSEVTVIEAMDRVLPMMDADASRAVDKSLKELGIKVHTGCAVDKIEEKGKGCEITFNKTEKVEADYALLSIGRVADLSGLGKLAEEIATERGKIVVDEHMRTNIPNIYAPGDLNGKCMLAHAAFKMGETAAKNAMGIDAVCDLSRVPSAVFTLPECASVGMSEADAEKKFGKANILVGKFPFMANGRALASNERAGFVKVIADKRYKELLGVHMVGADAAEMIAEASSLMAAEIPVDEIADIIHAHPTCAEAFMEACADALKECKHLPKK